MYNPDNHDLPEFQDERLTQYIYSYDVLLTHAVAFNSSEFDQTPWVEIDFQTPFRVRVPFHFMMWPDTPTIIEVEEVFNLDQLNRNHSGFDEVQQRITDLMKYSGDWAPDLDDWSELALGIGADRVGIVEYRVRYTWEVRAWEGLTLEHLESVLESTEEALEFSKAFLEEESFIVLDSNEPDDSNKRPAQLVLASDFDETEYEDPSKDGFATLDLSEYLSASGSSKLQSGLTGRGAGGFFSAIRSLFRR